MFSIGRQGLMLILMSLEMKWGICFRTIMKWRGEGCIRLVFKLV